ncbi:MAG: N-acyl homoserine lactonase family protein [Oscillospiraceae bacterium]|jgi:glyoxylase-like metal-dependent hydrolase (beta-lactamase superfamily II)|nr:N-acyl homoserine lactonase family protein [Oscillospiraceae bacterium]
MKVYVLKNGMNVDSIKNELIACDDPDERFNFPSWTVLIKHPDGNILFDAACHLNPERQAPFIMENLRMTPEDDPVYRVREAGVEPENVNYILLSHMHPDHFGYIDKFPNAEIIVSDNEFAGILKDTAMGRFPFVKDVVYFMQQGLKWSLFDDDVKFKELMPGVTIVNFGRGHSYGMLGLLLELQNDGAKLLISDVIYSSENVGPPLRRPGICRDPENWLRAMEYTLALAKERGAEIWYGHDLAQFETLRRSPEYYS